MRRLFALFFLPIFAMTVASAVMADEITLKKTNSDEWIILDSDGEQIGILRDMHEDGAYSIQEKNGEYLGVVKNNGDLQMPRRHPLLSPAEAQLYLDVLRALQTIK